MKTASLEFSFVVIAGLDEAPVRNGQDEDFVTRAIVRLPLGSGAIMDGVYVVEGEQEPISVNLFTVHSTSQDPFHQAANSIRIPGGTFASGTYGPYALPFDAALDNRGQYPCTYAEITFPYRLASWAKQAGEPRPIADQVTGPPPDPDKIKALIALTQAVNAARPNEPPITIQDQDVNAFLLMYYRANSPDLLHWRLVLFSSRTAYREALGDYLLGVEQKLRLEAEARAFASAAGRTITTESNLLDAVQAAIAEIKHAVESRRALSLFWHGNPVASKHQEKPTPKKEKEIQPVLHFLLDALLRHLGIQATRESDEGAGSVDFRFMYTTANGQPLTVAAEFKLAHHKNLRHGIRQQLPAYLRAIRSQSGLFVVMWFKDEKSRFFGEPKGRTKAELTAWLDEEARAVRETESVQIAAFVLDASIQRSASKR